MLRPLTALVCVVLVAGDGTDAAKKDLAKLQGQWIIVALEVNGADVAADRFAGIVLTVKDDSYIVKINDATLSSRVTLDPAKDPKELDMLFLEGTLKDNTQKCIYQFKDDTFQLSRGLTPEQKRPRDFATWSDSNGLVVTWKKK